MDEVTLVVNAANRAQPKPRARLQGNAETPSSPAARPGVRS